MKKTKYQKVAQMTADKLMAMYVAEEQTPEMDVFDILENHISNKENSFSWHSVCRLANKKTGRRSYESVSTWIADAFYNTDATDTCYAGFSSWVADMKD